MVYKPFENQRFSRDLYSENFVFFCMNLSYAKPKLSVTIEESNSFRSSKSCPVPI